MSVQEYNKQMREQSMDMFTYNKLLQDYGLAVAERYKKTVLGEKIVNDAVDANDNDDDVVEYKIKKSANKIIHINPLIEKKLRQLRDDAIRNIEIISNDSIQDKELKDNKNWRAFYTYNGTTLDVKGWASKLKITEFSFYRRIREWGICDKSFTFQKENIQNTLFTFEGKTQTMREWCTELSISEMAFRQKLYKYSDDSGSDTNYLFRSPYLHRYSFNGKTQSAEQWAKELGLTLSGLKYRVEQWGICQKTFTPKSSKNLTYQGVTQTMWEWCKELNISYSAFTERIRLWHGIDDAKVFKKNKKKKMYFTSFSFDCISEGRSTQ